MKTVWNNLIYTTIRMSYFNIASLFLILAISCSSGDTETNKTPSNLSVTITVVGANDQNPNGDGSGVIQVTATATNATRYAFRFNNGAVQESNSGIMEYAFSQEGTNAYSVVAWAYSETGEFLNETLSVTVFKSNIMFTNLVFFDEFENEGSPDTEKWHHQVIPPNNGGWHNSELQHYTARTENSHVSNGTLKIKALKEQFTYGSSTKSYTSARLNSKHAFTYGRVEVRAKLPAFAGTWPAIWTLGANSNETGNYFGNQFGSGQWPGCGEIDIMEQTGGDKNTIISHFHWGDRNTGEYKNIGGTTPIVNASGDFHIYSMEWTSNSIKTFVDDVLVYELPNSVDKPYDGPHYLLLNIAMGGNLGGAVPENFSEDTFEIDYVRVYQ